jgi:two-component system response regulator (stage 0 sporulation protein F)
MGKKILLVDDEEGIHLLYGEALVDEGYAVVSAYSGSDALRKFADDPPDLVILDIKLPDMNGVEVLRLMKERRPDLPVILSSAYEEYKEDFGSWASEAYLVKSADLDQLKEEVRKHLGRA